MRKRALSAKEKANVLDREEAGLLRAMLTVDQTKRVARDTVMRKLRS